MSYPKELDEYTDEELEKEIQRRAKLNNEGKCTYCNKLGSSPFCKQYSQHKKAKDFLENQGKDTRNPECIERWPECRSGEYNPECCRFPKSCSAG